MARAYSSDLRRSFLALVANGMSASGAARFFGIGRSTGIRWVIINRKEARSEALRSGGDRRSMKLEEYWEQVEGWLKETPDMTGQEICRKLEIEGIRVGQSSVRRMLHRHGMTYKKRQSMRRNRAGQMLQQHV